MLVQTHPQSIDCCAVHVSAPAKVNLFLEILGKRPDQFHELATVMTAVSLFDEIQFRPNDSGTVELSIANPEIGGSAIPVDQRNLIVAALIELRERFGIPQMGMEVVLDKHIPSSAGLGGASSNAAAAIVAGDLAWKLRLTAEDRQQIAAKIGSDVPFFLLGGTALCTGRGEKVTPVKSAEGIAMVIAKPVCGLSTPSVFKQCIVPEMPVDVNAFLDAVAQGRAEIIAGQLHNRLQPVAESLEGEVSVLAQAFQETECLGHQMSGSGTSYFGLFSSVTAAEKAADQLERGNPDWDVFRVTSLGQNVVTAA